MTPLLKRYLEANRSTIKSLGISLPSSHTSKFKFRFVPTHHADPPVLPALRTTTNHDFPPPTQIRCLHIEGMSMSHESREGILETFRGFYIQLFSAFRTPEQGTPCFDRTDIHLHDPGREKHVHFHGHPRLGRLADPHGVRCHRSSKKR
jgi:hypothetical protein